MKWGKKNRLRLTNGRPQRLSLVYSHRKSSARKLMHFSTSFPVVHRILSNKHSFLVAISSLGNFHFVAHSSIYLVQPKGLWLRPNTWNFTHIAGCAWYCTATSIAVPKWPDRSTSRLNCGTVLEVLFSSTFWYNDWSARDFPCWLMLYIRERCLATKRDFPLAEIL